MLLNSFYLIAPNVPRERATNETPLWGVKINNVPSGRLVGRRRNHPGISVPSERLVQRWLLLEKGVFIKVRFLIQQIRRRQLKPI